MSDLPTSSRILIAAGGSVPPSGARVLLLAFYQGFLILHPDPAPRNPDPDFRAGRGRPFPGTPGAGPVYSMRRAPGTGAAGSGRSGSSSHGGAHAGNQ